MSYLNKSFNKKNKIVSESVKVKYRARIKEGYTNRDILNAIDNCVADDFHRGKEYVYCTLEFFSRSNTLDKHGYESNNVNTNAIDKSKMTQDELDRLEWEASKANSERIKKSY